MKMNVLLVDDEVQLLEILTWELEDLGCNAESVSSGSQAIEHLKEKEIDLVISDIKMPDGDGLHLLKSIRELGMQTPVVFISGFSQYDEAELIEAGASALLAKPINMEKVAEIVKSVQKQKVG